MLNANSCIYMLNMELCKVDEEGVYIYRSHVPSAACALIANGRGRSLQAISSFTHKPPVRFLAMSILPSFALAQLAQESLYLGSTMFPA